MTGVRGSWKGTASGACPERSRRVPKEPSLDPPERMSVREEKPDDVEEVGIIRN